MHCSCWLLWTAGSSPGQKPHGSSVSAAALTCSVRPKHSVTVQMPSPPEEPPRRRMALQRARLRCGCTALMAASSGMPFMLRSHVASLNSCARKPTGGVNSVWSLPCSRQASSDSPGCHTHIFLCFLYCQISQQRPHLKNAGVLCKLCPAKNMEAQQSAGSFSATRWVLKDAELERQDSERQECQGDQCGGPKKAAMSCTLCYERMAAENC